MRHCVRCGLSYPQKKGTPTPPNIWPVYCGQMAGWMKTPLSTEVDLGPGHIILDGVPAPAKGAQQPPLFGPCLLWPRSPISATAELLYCYSDIFVNEIMYLDCFTVIIRQLTNYIDLVFDTSRCCVRCLSLVYIGLSFYPQFTPSLPIIFTLQGIHSVRHSAVEQSS